jgi:hypothetical protein
MRKSVLLLLCALSLMNAYAWSTDATPNVIVLATKRMPQGQTNVVIDTNPHSGHLTLLQCVSNQAACVMPLAGDTAKILAIDNSVMTLLYSNGRIGLYEVAESYSQ